MPFVLLKRTGKWNFFTTLTLKKEFYLFEYDCNVHSWEYQSIMHALLISKSRFEDYGLNTKNVSFTNHFYCMTFLKILIPLNILNLGIKPCFWELDKTIFVKINGSINNAQCWSKFLVSILGIVFLSIANAIHMILPSTKDYSS